MNVYHPLIQQLFHKYTLYRDYILKWKYSTWLYIYIHCVVDTMETSSKLLEALCANTARTGAGFASSFIDPCPYCLAIHLSTWLWQAILCWCVTRANMAWYWKHYITLQQHVSHYSANLLPLFFIIFPLLVLPLLFLPPAPF